MFNSKDVEKVARVEVLVGGKWIEIWMQSSYRDSDKRYSQRLKYLGHGLRIRYDGEESAASEFVWALTG